MERALRRFSRHAQSLQVHTGEEQSVWRRVWFEATGGPEGPKRAAAGAGGVQDRAALRPAAVVLRLRLVWFIA